MAQNTQRFGVVELIRGEIAMNEQIRLLMHALSNAGIGDGLPLMTIAGKIVEYFPPQVVEIERTDTKCVLEIKSCPDTSLVISVLTGGKNPEAYAQPDGHEHALVRIGSCSLTVSHFFPGEILAEIKRVKLIRRIPLGAAVNITLTKKEFELTKGGFMTTSLMEGCLTETGKAIFAPSDVITFKRDGD